MEVQVLHMDYNYFQNTDSYWRDSFKEPKQRVRNLDNLIYVTKDARYSGTNENNAPSPFKNKEACWNPTKYETIEYNHGNLDVRVVGGSSTITQGVEPKQPIMETKLQTEKAVVKRHRRTKRRFKKIRNLADDSDSDDVTSNDKQLKSTRRVVGIPIGSQIHNDTETCVGTSLAKGDDYYTDSDSLSTKRGRYESDPPYLSETSSLELYSASLSSKKRRYEKDPPYLPGKASLELHSDEEMRKYTWSKSERKCKMFVPKKNDDSDTCSSRQIDTQRTSIDCLSLSDKLKKIIAVSDLKECSIELHRWDEGVKIVFLQESEDERIDQEDLIHSDESRLFLESSDSENDDKKSVHSFLSSSTLPLEVDDYQEYLSSSSSDVSIIYGYDYSRNLSLPLVLKTAPDEFEGDPFREETIKGCFGTSLVQTRRPPEIRNYLSSQTNFSSLTKTAILSEPSLLKTFLFMSSFFGKLLYTERAFLYSTFEVVPFIKLPQTLPPIVQTWTVPAWLTVASASSKASFSKSLVLKPKVYSTKKTKANTVWKNALESLETRKEIPFYSNNSSTKSIYTWNRAVIDNRYDLNARYPLKLKLIKQSREPILPPVSNCDTRYVSSPEKERKPKAIRRPPASSISRQFSLEDSVGRKPPRRASSSDKPLPQKKPKHSSCDKPLAQKKPKHSSSDKPLALKKPKHSSSDKPLAQKKPKHSSSDKPLAQKKPKHSSSDKPLAQKKPKHSSSDKPLAQKKPKHTQEKFSVRESLSNDLKIRKFSESKVSVASPEYEYDSNQKKGQRTSIGPDNITSKSVKDIRRPSGDLDMPRLDELLSTPEENKNNPQPGKVCHNKSSEKSASIKLTDPRIEGLDPKLCWKHTNRPIAVRPIRICQGRRAAQVRSSLKGFQWKKILIEGINVSWYHANRAASKKRSSSLDSSSNNTRRASTEEPINNKRTFEKSKSSVQNQSPIASNIVEDNSSKSCNKPKSLSLNEYKRRASNAEKSATENRTIESLPAIIETASKAVSAIKKSSSQNNSTCDTFSKPVDHSIASHIEPEEQDTSVQKDLVFYKENLIKLRAQLSNLKSLAVPNENAISLKQRQIDAAEVLLSSYELELADQDLVSPSIIQPATNLDVVQQAPTSAVHMTSDVVTLVNQESTELQHHTPSDVVTPVNQESTELQHRTSSDVVTRVNLESTQHQHNTPSDVATRVNQESTEHQLRVDHASTDLSVTQVDQGLINLTVTKVDQGPINLTVTQVLQAPICCDGTQAALDPTVNQAPTLDPTVNQAPTLDPTVNQAPTLDPTVNQAPTLDPTVNQAPTLDPTVNQAPTLDPTVNQAPTLDPTVNQAPTLDPTVNQAPTLDPTVNQAPTLDPTVNQAPTLDPTVNQAPTLDPTVNQAPTLDPTVNQAPTLDPTVNQAPTLDPTVNQAPTLDPTVNQAPTLDPTVNQAPTLDPTVNQAPTLDPTVNQAPTLDPTVNQAPTLDPTVNQAPTLDPTVNQALQVQTCCDGTQAALDPTLNQLSLTNLESTDQTNFTWENKIIDFALKCANYFEVVQEASDDRNENITRLEKLREQLRLAECLKAGVPAQLNEAHMEVINSVCQILLEFISRYETYLSNSTDVRPSQQTNVKPFQQTNVELSKSIKEEQDNDVEYVCTVKRELGGKSLTSTESKQLTQDLMKLLIECYNKLNNDQKQNLDPGLNHKISIVQKIVKSRGSSENRTLPSQITNQPVEAIPQRQSTETRFEPTHNCLNVPVEIPNQLVTNRPPTRLPSIYDEPYVRHQTQPVVSHLASSNVTGVSHQVSNYAPYPVSAKPHGSYPNNKKAGDNSVHLSQTATIVRQILPACQNSRQNVNLPSPNVELVPPSNNFTHPTFVRIAPRGSVTKSGCRPILSSMLSRTDKYGNLRSATPYSYESHNNLYPPNVHSQNQNQPPIRPTSVTASLFQPIYNNRSASVVTNPIQSLQNLHPPVTMSSVSSINFSQHQPGYHVTRGATFIPRNGIAPTIYPPVQYTTNTRISSDIHTRTNQMPSQPAHQVNFNASYRFVTTQPQVVYPSNSVNRADNPISLSPTTAEVSFNTSPGQFHPEANVHSQLARNYGQDRMVSNQISRSTPPYSQVQQGQPYFPPTTNKYPAVNKFSQVSNTGGQNTMPFQSGFFPSWHKPQPN